MRWIILALLVTGAWFFFVRQPASPSGEQGGQMPDGTTNHYQAYSGATAVADDFGASIPSRPVTNVGTAAKSSLQKVMVSLGIFKQ